MNNNYVYVYLDPRKPGNFNYGEYHFDFEPFYIGKGTYTRWKIHLLRAKNKNFKRKSLVISKIKAIIEKNNSDPIILKIQDKMTEFCSLGLEKFLIKLIGRNDYNLGPLLNLTDGGDGVCNPSLESRERKSKKLKNRIFKEESKELMSKNNAKNFLNHIWISKENEEKSIHKNDIDFYLSEGWNLGYIPGKRSGENNGFFGKSHSEKTKKQISKFSAGKIYINCLIFEKRVSSLELDSYYEQGWILGRCPFKNTENFGKTKNRIIVNNGTKVFYIQKEKIDSYIEQGYNIGRIKRSKL